MPTTNLLGKGTFEALGDWSNLLIRLRENGFPITVDRETRLATLMWRLTEAGVSLESWQAAASYLGPILCVTPDDTKHFAEIIKDHYDRRAFAASPTKMHARSLTEIASTASTNWLVWIISIAVGVGIAGLATIIVMFVEHHTIIPPDIPLGPGRSSQNVSIPELSVILWDLAIRVICASPALFIFAALLVWRSHHEAVLVRKAAAIGREENFFIPYRASKLFGDVASRRAFLILKRGLSVSSQKLDVFRTVRATVAAAGWPIILLRRRVTNVELVMFVDRSRMRDHLGYLADILVDRLKALQTLVTRYDYRYSPSSLTLESGRADGPATQTLARVSHRHTDHRLILVTDGNGLFNSGTATLDPLIAREFRRFGHVIMLTPTPEEAWGERERALSSVGTLVVPATARGFPSAPRCRLPSHPRTLLADQFRTSRRALIRSSNGLNATFID